MIQVWTISKDTLEVVLARQLGAEDEENNQKSTQRTKKIDTETFFTAADKKIDIIFLNTNP